MTTDLQSFSKIDRLLQRSKSWCGTCVHIPSFLNVKLVAVDDDESWEYLSQEDILFTRCGTLSSARDNIGLNRYSYSKKLELAVNLMLYNFLLCCTHLV